jgi:hypothetical protein
MKKLPNGFMAAHVAEMLRDRPGLTSDEIARLFRIGDVRAREILTQAREKESEWRLAHMPPPNHENTTKEWNR